MSRKSEDDPIQREQADAWLGDAVLALYVRQWLLDRFGRADGDLQGLVTSNQFLSRFGNPTAVEAEIGREYRAGGLAVAYAGIEKKLLAEMIRQLRRQRPSLAGRLPALPMKE